MHMYAYRNRYIHMLTHIHPQTYIYMHTYTHRDMLRINTYLHTHPHTHTYIDITHRGAFTCCPLCFIVLARKVLDFFALSISFQILDLWKGLIARKWGMEKELGSGRPCGEKIICFCSWQMGWGQITQWVLNSFLNSTIFANWYEPTRSNKRKCIIWDQIPISLKSGAI